MVVLPGTNPTRIFFNELDFTADYRYTFILLGAIAINACLSYGCEKFIVSNITAASDKAQIKNKQILCKTQMDEAKAEVKKRM